MSSLKWARSRVRKYRRSRRGISTIMANLTMLIIVVSLASILFVWATSSFGAYTGGAGYWFSSRSIANSERVSVESVFFGNNGPSNSFTLYVRNVGTIPFTVSSVYLNSTLYQVAYPPIPVNGVQQIQPCIACGGAWVHGDLQSLRVATIRGTVVTSNWVS